MIAGSMYAAAQQWQWSGQLGQLGSWEVGLLWSVVGPGRFQLAQSTTPRAKNRGRGRGYAVLNVMFTVGGWGGGVRLLYTLEGTDNTTGYSTAYPPKL